MAVGLVPGTLCKLTVCEKKSDFQCKTYEGKLEAKPGTKELHLVPDPGKVVNKGDRVILTCG